jgi:acetyl-CoA synthetase
MIERYGVTIYYYAPTAIRAFMKAGEQHPKKHDLSSLRLLVRSGAHQPRGVDVVHRVIGGRAVPDRRHLVADRDGRHHADDLPGVHDAKPGAAGRPFFGSIRASWTGGQRAGDGSGGC